MVDSDKFIETHLPRTKEMLEGFLANPATAKKTPLAILHEYASRMSLEVGASVLHASPSCTVSEASPLSEANGPLVEWCFLGSGMQRLCVLWRGAERCCRRLTLPPRVGCMGAALCLKLLAPVVAASGQAPVHQ